MRRTVDKMKKTLCIFDGDGGDGSDGLRIDKEIAYLQGRKRSRPRLAQQTVPLYDARIMPNLLTITVTAADQVGAAV